MKVTKGNVTAEAQLLDPVVRIVVEAPISALEAVRDFLVRDPGVNTDNFYAALDEVLEHWQ